MPIFAYLLLIVGASCLLFSTVLVFIFKQPNTSALDILSKGSFVYRKLQDHIVVNWVKPIYALLYMGLSCILIAIFGVLIVNI